VFRPRHLPSILTQVLTQPQSLPAPLPLFPVLPLLPVTMDVQQQAAMERHIAQIVDQRLAQAARVGGSAPAERTPRGKLHDNARYGGGERLDAWLGTICQYADFYAIEGEAPRVAYAAAHLKESALHWWQTMLPERRPGTWAALTEQLRLRFQPVTSAELARTRLDKCAQGKGGVQAYTAAIQTLLTYLPSMSVGDRVHAYMRGLNDRVRAHVAEVPHATLESAIERAARFSGYQHLANASVGGFAAAGAPMELDALGIGLYQEDSSSSSSEHDPFHSLVSPPVSVPAAAPRMYSHDELHALIASAMATSRTHGDGNRRGGHRGAPARGRGLPLIPHLSPEQVKAYMDAGRCFGCGSNDHRSRQCPKRTVGADGRPSWGK
jgi:hypothetical protein